MRSDGFTPGCVENPVLQRHYAAVQALALGEEGPEETMDLLQVAEADLVDKMDVISNWRAAIDAIVPPSLCGSKRHLADGDDLGGPRTKTARGSQAVTILPSASEDDMRSLIQSGEIHHVSVAALRDWLRAQGVSSSGKKADLIERIHVLV